jgi:hypothetical protein
LKVNQNINFDPIKALYNKNIEIKQDFFKRFDRDLEIDDEIANMEVDTSAYDALFARA